MRIFSNIISFSALASILMLGHSYSFAQGCKTSQISKYISRFTQAPYKYDNHTVNEFVFDNKEKKFEVQFTAFKGLKYKILFTTPGYLEEIAINIYDKKATPNKERKNLMADNQKIENSYWIFEPQKAGNYYIEYNIPKSLSEEVKSGCIIMIVAFSDK